MINLNLIKNDLKIILKNYYIIPRILKSKIHGLIHGKSNLLSVDIYITDKCQCNCEHCYNVGNRSNKSMLNQKKKITLSQIKKSLSDAEELGAINITLLGGEPLLSEDLFKIVSFAKRNKLTTFINTNGEYLTKDRIIDLKKSGLTTVHMSLDFMDGRHDLFRNRKGLYKKVINNIELCKKLGMDVLISSVVTSERIKDGTFSKIVNFADKNKIFVQVNQPIKIGKWENDTKNNLSVDEHIDLRKKLKGKRLKIFNDHHINLKCCAGSERIIITYDGECIPCENLRVSYGNIQKESLKDIYKRMYNCKFLDVLRKEVAPCQKEPYISRYFNKLKSMVSYKDLNNLLFKERYD